MDIKTVIQLASEFAHRNSTCIEKTVASAIFDDSDSCIVGCNGSKVIVPECECDGKDQCQHAEINVLISAFMSNTEFLKRPETFYMYVSNSPCTGCATAIIQSGIKMVYIGDLNSRFNGIKLLRENGVTVIIIANNNNNEKINE